MGVTLVNTALPWADLVKMNSSNNTLAGFFPDVVTILGKVLNFKYFHLKSSPSQLFKTI